MEGEKKAFGAPPFEGFIGRYGTRRGLLPEKLFRRYTVILSLRQYHSRGKVCLACTLTEAPAEKSGLRWRAFSNLSSGQKEK
jgi:hypothetical protein